MNHRDFLCRAHPSHESLLKILFLRSQDEASAWLDWRKKFASDLNQSGIKELHPLLYLKFNRKSIDTEILDIFSKSYNHVSTANELAFVEVRQVLTQLMDHDIRYLLIKGMSLLPYYNNNPALRPMADVDLLVHEHSVMTVIDLLFQIGWQPLPAYSRQYLAQRIVPRLHSWAFLRNGVQLDLHWQPVHKEIGDFGTKNIWDRSTTVRVFNTEVFVPCSEDQLLLSLLHGIRPQVNRRVQWVVDAMLILKMTDNYFDWEYFCTNLRRSKLVYLVRDMLGYLDFSFGIKLPMTDSCNPLDKILCRLEYKGMLLREGDRQISQIIAGLGLKFYRNLSSKKPGKHVTELTNYGLSVTRPIIERLYQRSLSRTHKNEILFAIVTRIFPDFGRPSTPDWPVPFLPEDGSVRFKSIGPGFLYAVSGWSNPEDLHLWSDGWESRLVFALQPSACVAFRIELDFHSFIAEDTIRARIDITINHRPCMRLEFPRQHYPVVHAFIITAHELVVSKNNVDILLSYLEPGTPKNTSIAAETRLLGACLRQLKTAPVYPWNIKQPLKFIKDQPACKYLEFGWWDVGIDGVQSAMSQASVRIPIIEQEYVPVIGITLIPLVCGVEERSVEVIIRGTYSGSCSFQPRRQESIELNLELSETAANNPTNVIEVLFKMDKCVQPGDSITPGPEQFGVKLLSIQCINSA